MCNDYGYFRGMTMQDGSPYFGSQNQTGLAYPYKKCKLISFVLST